MPTKSIRVPGCDTGAAIIAAMLVTAVVATLATGMLAEMNRWFARSQLARDQAQARSLAAAAVRWSAQYLREEQRLGPLDHLGELWANALPATPVEGGTLAGTISDAQGKFNLSNVRAPGGVSARDVAFAERLMRAQGLSASQVSAFIPAFIAKNTNYLGDVAALPPEQYAQLDAVATALPVRTPINVNTAPERVLRALVPDAKPERWADRVVRPFTSVQDFATRVGATPDVEISVATRYFYVDAQATLGSARAGSLALVDRTQGVVWEVSQ